MLYKGNGCINHNPCTSGNTGPDHKKEETGQCTLRTVGFIKHNYQKRKKKFSKQNDTKKFSKSSIYMNVSMYISMWDIHLPT